MSTTNLAADPDEEEDEEEEEEVEVPDDDDIDTVLSSEEEEEEEEMEEVGLYRQRLDTRRGIAEDRRYNLVAVEPLEIDVLKHYIDVFTEDPVDLELLDKEQKEYVIDNLPLNIPLELVADTIEDGSYWMRKCSQLKEETVELSTYGGSWKRQFFERFLEDKIINYAPRLSDPEEIVEWMKIGGKYVVRLNVTQLLIPVKRIPVGPMEEEEEKDLEDIDDWEKDHLDISKMAQYFPNLENLQMCYGLNKCGMNFDWSFFRFTYRDCLWLIQFVKDSPGLKSLTIHRSRMDDVKVLMVIKGMAPKSNLREIHFPHNIVSDDGARVLARYLDKNKTVHVLDLYDNNIGSEGGLAFAFCLRHNKVLKCLNLRLNLLKDEGAGAIARALTKNKKTALTELNVASNGVTEAGAKEFAKVLDKLKLLKLDLSSNPLTMRGGKSILVALESNDILLELELRETGAHEDYIYCIEKKLYENRMKVRSRLKEQEAEERAAAAVASGEADGEVEEKPKVVKLRTTKMSRFCKN